MELSPEQKQQLEEQKQHCPFCKIITGEIPSQQVYEDDKLIAILDINPAREGHTLVVPKEHYPVMALMPEDLFEHLFSVLPQMTRRLRDAVLAKHCTVFMANGAAAGQQSGHFLIHLIPSGAPLPSFNPPRERQDDKAVSELREVLGHNLPLMLRDRSEKFAPEEPAGQDQEQQLAQLLEQNPEFKQMLMDKPEAVLAGLEDNPSLKPLFAGVDVHALSEKLNEQAGRPSDQLQEQPRAEEEVVPRAADLSDDQLRAYLTEHERLDYFLRNDPETLEQAVEQQPRLQRFFEESSVQQVRARLQPDARDASLEDLAGGGA